MGSCASSAYIGVHQRLAGKHKEDGENRMKETPFFMSIEREDNGRNNSDHGDAASRSARSATHTEVKPMDHKREGGGGENRKRLGDIVVPRVFSIEKRNGREVCTDKVEGGEGESSIVKAVDTHYAAQSYTSDFGVDQVVMLRVFTMPLTR